MTSSASLTTIAIYNLDSGAHVVGGTIAELGNILRGLGFEIDHATDVTYTAPAA
jgi:hypothetical protein